MIRIGACSWKYDSWKGIIYPVEENINYLQEYSEHFNTVEVDQWFWSLFDKKVILPSPKDVDDYKNAVKKDFKFTIKVPNSITLTHYYTKDKSQSLKQNPHFLSNDLFEEFLKILKPIEKQIGTLMFQFEYLNKQKMPSLKEFQNKFYNFYSGISADAPPISLEIRNPNYLTPLYFKFLDELKIAHVFLEGYYMPSVCKVYETNKESFKGMSIIRFHGPDRSGIEKLSGQNWNKIYINRDKELLPIIKMIRDLETRDVDIYLNINNHYEGCAPLTINKIKKLLDSE
jgi:uncharacterized protein YecE (DUF72 family)